MALEPGADDLTPFLRALEGNQVPGQPPEYQSAGTASALTCEEFPPLPRAATTDADGRFRLRGVGRERMAVVLIGGPGLATREVRILTRTTAGFHLLGYKEDPFDSLDYYGATFTYVAPPTRPVVGVVRDKDTQKPLAGVKVQSYRRASRPGWARPLVETTTDLEGRYRLVGMPPRANGNKVVALPPEGKPYLAASRDVSDAEGLGAVTVDLEVKRGVWVRGKVTDGMTRKPVRCYVAYNVFEDNPHHQDPFALFTRSPVAETGDDGTFRLLVLPGRGLIGAGALAGGYCLGIGADRVQAGLDASGHFRTYPSCVSPRDYHTLVEVDPAREAESVTCDIVLRPGRALTGTVVDPDGKPLPGARVSGLYSSGTWDQEPLKTAAFTLTGLEPDRARLVQFAHADRRLAGFLVVRPGDHGPLAIKLRPAGTLTGRLVTRAGRPLADLEIGAVCGDPPARPGGTKEDPPDGSFPGVRSDQNGKFRIKGLAPGLKYRLCVLRGSSLLDPQVGKHPTLQPGETKDLGDVRVNRVE
jgi:hypothetical protein